MITTEGVSDIVPFSVSFLQHRNFRNFLLPENSSSQNFLAFNQFLSEINRVYPVFTFASSFYVFKICGFNSGFSQLLNDHKGPCVLSRVQGLS